LTGATSGIGRVTAEALARAGARLIVHGRDRDKVASLVEDLSHSRGDVRSLSADLASLADTARLAREVPDDLDVLINNAGVGFGRERKVREESRDGFELRFAVNYLAPFLLTEELLARGLPRRAVINVASVGQEPLDFDDLMSARGYDGVRAYRRSKLALVMMTFDLAERHPELQVYALHPGTLLDTTMVRESGIQSLGPVSRGAETVLVVLETALAGGESGRYFDEEEPARANAQAYDAGVRQRLREAALAIVTPFRKA
jgi:NAD(P)-dependent dehydrogenase (short-subunit alcohol dehydrogenase family)